MKNTNNDARAIPRRKLLGLGAAAIGAMVATTAVSAKSHADPTAGPIDVKNFGATGLRKDNATKPFREAIAACATRGGGTVNVPPGEYTVGTIQLKDNVTLNLEAGATLFVSQDKADFIEGARSLIFAEGAKNIGLTGKGTIDGLARYDYVDMRSQDPEIEKEVAIARAAGIEIKRYYRSSEAMNVFLVVLNDCTNVLMTDVSLINAPLWTVRLNDCDRVYIRGVYLFSNLEKGVNADGIDICSSRNVTISDSVIITADDAIVLKSIARNGKAANIVENVTVTNCVLTSSSTPLMIGTETEADIRHVVFNNCVIRNSNKGFGINVQDGATVSNVILSNLTIETNRRHWNWWGDAEMFKFILRKRTPQSKLGKIKDITIDNIIARPRGTSTVTAPAESPIENLRISNVHLTMTPEDAKDKRSSHAIRMTNVKGLKIRDLSIDWEEEGAEAGWQSALVLKDVSDFSIDGLSARQGLKGKDIPAIVLENTSDGVIRNSKALAGTKMFIEIRGSGTSDLLLSGNNTRSAEKAFVFENDTVKKGAKVK